MIKAEKLEALKQRLERLGVKDGDLVEKFIMGSGKGGQKVNKTSSCVYLKHLVSGIEIKCQVNRSREMNRYYARKDLCDKLDERDSKVKSARQQAVEKIRRQKKRRSRRQKEKMLDDKKHHSSKKQLRQTPKDQG
jgi:protein subunit release factor B